MDALVILGATAVGKSRLATEIAGELGGEILSVDSRQVYKHIDIGTAKPTPEDRRKVRHHLIDLFELHEKNNAERFSRMAWDAIKDVVSRHGLPILVGGSGLYLKAIFDGLFSIDLDEGERAVFADSVKGASTGELYRRLMSVDQESCKRINPKDRYRIVRALEVYVLSGLPLSEHFRNQGTAKWDPAVSILKVGLNMPRETLHRRINERTRRMFEDGWVSEVEGLLRGGASPDWPGLKTLGYPEVISHIRDRVGRDEVIGKISTLTRRYAKRQITWFRREKGVTWLDAEDRAIKRTVLELIENTKHK